MACSYSPRVHGNKMDANDAADPEPDFIPAPATNMYENMK